ncbi:MAG: hypothetical protein AB7U85_09690 [Alphaproteobacteria bacterium]
MSTKNFITFIWLFLAIFVGVGMYILKYEVKKLETELASLNDTIRKDQENIHVLKAEWSHLNNPERIKNLAERYIKLEPVSPEQIIAVADLPIATDKQDLRTFASSNNLEADLNKRLKKLVSTRD